MDASAPNPPAPAPNPQVPGTPPVVAGRTSLVGPVVLTSVAALLVVAAVVVTVLVVRAFAGLLPLGVVGADGGAGPAAVGESSVPGTVELELEEGLHDVFLVLPGGQAHGGLEGEVLVVGPDGGSVDVDDAPGVSISAARGDHHAFNVAAFRAPTAGEYTLTFPPSTPPDALAVVAEGQEVPSFLAGVFGTIAGVLVAVALGVVAIPLLITGIAWWVVRASARRRVPA
ncbi:hypothetical protein [Cellulomonas fimi]|uniref:Uncharacterized protein n=1 Tax=Cellulomonas fimi (strain ATCC 484 / DSM 20113 / JCM 1341 / CCUG 24087 / LMG 16345 / NBRC 15513 / NCIMB 8980 / NCTC 7547 / NRS-133) TaxID=590998 RepID=F4H5F9_CELFA|nr:hypothetical protein [Cellulomonas fimi]AEE47882.1 hypothetical protein Celf_3776 [Cellulomonas fimi ATCC 484]NNH05981.1 hypothetical protein [Cellulomonas fimi]VEH37062.1 Uncharacterised protein [Cellulomonas fimi]